MRATLVLGANRGDREACLDAAVATMRAMGVRVLRRSEWTETLPVGATGRAHFLNGVVEIETDLLPRVLLRRLRGIEHALGRRRLSGGKATPRTVDIDLVRYKNVRMATRELTLPHPRWAVAGLSAQRTDGRRAPCGRAIRARRPGAAG